MKKPRAFDPLGPSSPLLALELSSSRRGPRPGRPTRSFPRWNPFGDKKEDTREKTYVQKTALRWELSRRYSEHVIEEYLPKFEAIVKRSKPETSDFTDWRTLGGQLYVSWEESRKHEKTGTGPSDQRAWEERAPPPPGADRKGRGEPWSSGGTASPRSRTLQKEADEAAGRFERSGRT